MAGYVGNVPVPQSVREDQSFTATAGQTTFNTLGYTDGNRIKVTLNGVLLEGGGVDYTATNGSDVVLTVAAAADDIVRFETFNEVSLVSSVTTTPTFKTSATLLNETEEDIEGGRESTLIFQGEQSGGELSTLAEIEASHDGTADDEKGDLIFRTNDGNDGTSPTERLRISSDSTFTFASNDAGSGIGPNLVYYRNSASPADNDLLAEIDHRGRNDNSQDVDYATVNIFAEDVSDGTEDGKYLLQTMKAGATVSRMDVNSTETVFNDDSKELNFRVESDDSTHILFVDGANDRVGINQDTPTGMLHVKGTSTAHGKVVVEAGGSGGSANNNFIEFNKHDGTKLAEIEVGESVANGGDIIFKTTPSGGSVTNRIRLRHDGGICFGTDNATANALDDYEEGTFNLTMAGYHGNPSTTQLIPCQYTKIGNTIHFWGYKTGVNNTGASAHMWFTGLPFSSPSPYAVGNLYFDGVAQLPTSPFAWISGTIVYAYRHVNNGTAVGVYHNVVTSGSVQIYGTYKV